MSKLLLGVISGATMPINVMSDLVHKHVLKVKRANGIEVVAAEFKRMRAEEHAFVPVDAIATERAAPRALLLARARKQKHSAQSYNVLGSHALETLPHFKILDRLHKIWSQSG
jgi:hypothetical protein